MINPFLTSNVIRTVAIAAFVVLVILLFVFAIDGLMLAFASVLLAVFLRGLADWLSERTNIGKGFSLAIVGISLLTFLVGAVYLLAPDVADQYKELQREIPESVSKLRGTLEKYNWGRVILQKIPEMGDAVSNGDGGNAISQVGKFFSSTFNVILNFVVFLLLGIYLAAEPRTYTEGFLLLFPQNRRGRIREVLEAIGETLRWWLVGKFASMLVIGVMTTIGLRLLGVPLSLTLGLFAALLTFIPNFGPIIAVIPAALLALANNPISALYVLLLYYGIQFVESYLITPNIERHTVQLPPALTIATQLILSVLVGGLGLVLATPLVAVAMVLVQMLYIEDILGEDIQTPNEKRNERRKPKTLIQSEETSD
jgi:predicted PurR-regulated permease PerM